MMPVKKRSVQVTYDSKPLAGADVFVMDEFNVEPLKSDRDGIVWFDTRDDYKSVYLAAVSEDRLAARPEYVTFPDDGSPLGGRRWSAYTDEDGVASTRAGPGELEVSVSEDDWREEAKLSISSLGMQDHW